MEKASKSSTRGVEFVAIVAIVTLLIFLTKCPFSSSISRTATWALGSEAM